MVYLLYKVECVVAGAVEELLQRGFQGQSPCAAQTGADHEENHLQAAQSLNGLINEYFLVETTNACGLLWMVRDIDFVDGQT